VVADQQNTSGDHPLLVGDQQEQFGFILNTARFILGLKKEPAMVPELRKKFNAAFTPGKYMGYMNELEALHPGGLDFRNAETPIFVPKAFKDKILEACERITDVIVSDGFNKMTNGAIPPGSTVPGENPYSDFIVFDFGVCENATGELEPQLIEMQGFPTLFAFQVYHTAITRAYANVPENFDAYLNGYTPETYTALLRDIIVGDCNPENVILLEVFPHQQKTRIDFYCTQKLLQVNPVCITELIREDRNLFYMNNGIKTPVKRIYNRIIFDDLEQQSAEVQEKGKILLEDLDVQWVSHPNWFYRISKHTLPMIRHQYVPETHYLSDIKQPPADLENYVLKPLFSFAGQGVILDVTMEHIEKTPNPENWILQRKVKYADIIETLDVNAKAEIRIFYFWKKGWARPQAVLNLSRLSKGKMIGTRYNKDKEWVGGSVAFFEK
jgi:hypothetical protein